MAVESLPYIDEHSIIVPGSAEAVWNGALATFGGLAGNPFTRGFARVVGCEPHLASGWSSGAVGSSIPRFEIVEARRFSLLVLSGRHHFSRYAIVLRIEGLGTSTGCRLESRGEFPGPAGKLYRLAVIGTGFHVLAVRRLLRQISAAAVRTRGRPPP